jgi:hypothetical protein
MSLSEVERIKINKLVVDAYAAADTDYNLEVAVKWSLDEDGLPFKFPPEVHSRHAAELVALDYDLTGLIDKHQKAMLPDRINLERLKGRDPLHPDTARLRDIAEHGIRIPLAPDFIEDRNPAEIKDNTYLRAHSAIDKMWYSLYLAGFLLIIPTAVLALVPTAIMLNYSPPGWARKRGKESGRQTSDHSRKNRFGHAVNSKVAKELVKTLYGPIAPVQIESLVLMLIHQAERVGGWHNLVCWKMDLLGAFNLIFFHPSDAGLLAMELSDNLTMISLVGSFGATHTPYAFDVLSRTVCTEINSDPDFCGEGQICCDDFMGACAKWELETDKLLARKHILKIFGPNSINEKKWEDTESHPSGSRRIDFIGWSVDLDTLTLGIARHNVLKVVHGFCIMRTRTHLSAREIQKLASWSTRYSLICRYMRPFASFLYAAGCGYKNLETQIPMTEDLRTIMDLWLMFLVLMELDPKQFTRPFLSFSTPSAPTRHINLDASLTGIGLIISSIPPDAVRLIRDVTLLEEQMFNGRAGQWAYNTNDLRTVAVVGYDLPYELKGDSSYQNAVEFIAIVAASLLATSLGWSGESFIVQGDSTTALSWITKGNFRAGRSTPAAICYMQLLQGSRGFLLAGAEHIAGAVNPSDPLSRGIDPGSIHDPRVVVDLRSNPAIEQLILGMDPSCPLPIREFLRTMWSSNIALLNKLQSISGGWESNPFTHFGQDRFKLPSHAEF